MKLTRADADIFVPDGSPVAEALARTTHLAVGAHQDDLEFMALHGILECVDRPDRWFTGITMTDGSGSPRSGPYAGHSDRQMVEVRIEEQRQAARLGRYGCQIQLMHPSSAVKHAAFPDPVDDLGSVIGLARPEVVYLHNPADKHDTHVACCLRSIEALRRLPPDSRPAAVYGCEVWRDLDWLADADKVVLPLDDPGGLGLDLAAVFASQIAGGKRYDLAVQGRRLANATFFESHAVDRHRLASFAMDLTPLLTGPALDVAAFTSLLVGRLRSDVEHRIARLSQPG
jgi:LmbE family N-acetylglucosaminyl deacetylase